MKGDTQAPFAIAKVLPAGMTPDGVLRAVVSLIPAYTIDSLPALKAWPSTVICWLREMEWQLPLSVSSAVHVESGSKSWCWTDVVQSQSTGSVCVCATVSARATWSSQREFGWLDNLWRAAMNCDKTIDTQKVLCDSEDETFKSLRSVLERSTRGSAISGELDEKRVQSVGDDDKPLERSSASNQNSITVKSLIASRQSDLAIMFEAQRALELCASLQDVRLPPDLQSSANQGVAESTPTGTEGAQASSFLASFNTAAKRQYDGAKKNLVEAHDGQAISKCLAAASPPDAKDVGDKPQSGSDKDVAHATPASLAAYSNADEVDANIEGPLETYRAATQRERHTQYRCDGKDGDRDTQVAQRFFAVQGSPALSRLFGLTLDITIDADKVIGSLTDSPESNGARFAYLGIDSTVKCAAGVACRLFTLTKVSVMPKSFFYPVSRAEVGMASRAATGATGLPQLSQYDGLVILGRPISETNFTSRFEITSLDVRAAAEAALDKKYVADSARLQREHAAAESKAPELSHEGAAALSAKGAAFRPDSKERQPCKTFITGGLTILDRGRQLQAATQLATRDSHGQKLTTSGAAIVLDADDLLVGYRIDVGVRLRSTGDYCWRSLMARTIRHGITGVSSDKVKTALETLLGGGKGHGADEWRSRLEDAVIALPTRLIAHDDPNKADAYVEEALVTWNDEPLAVSTAGSRDDKVKDCALPVGQVISLPTARAGSKRCPPPLRFGLPYRFGLRAVYPGGLSVSLDEAVQSYDQPIPVPGLGSFTLPASEATNASVGKKSWASTETGCLSDNTLPNRELRRFLRQERIDAPYLLLPEFIALRRNGPMGFERASHAVVRTAYTNEGKAREHPTETQRIFMVSNVSHSFAAFHGVFDKVDAACPTGGLCAPTFGPAGARLDADAGHFPVVVSDSLVGINGAEYEMSRTISTNTSQHHGDLVYSTGRGGARNSEYYPDPAADFYVLRLRYSGTSEYLSGDPVCVPVYDAGRLFPHARPLAVTIVRSTRTRAREEPPKLQDIVSLRLNNGTRPVPGAVHVLISLEPGDDFELDVWCLPCATRLAKYFSVVEALGALILSKAVGGEPFDLSAMSQAMESLISRSFSSAVGKTLSSDDWIGGYSGLAGLQSPGPKALKAIGEAVFDIAAVKPVTELSAFRTLRVTHAIDRPRTRPVYRRPGVLPNVPLQCPTYCNARSAHISKQKAAAELLEGVVVADFHTTGAIDIQVLTPAPRSTLLDDPERGRTVRQMREVTWPTSLGSVRVRDLVKTSSLLHNTEKVFGFAVDDAGRVCLPRTSVVLYQVDHFPPPGKLFPRIDPEPPTARTPGGVILSSLVSPDLPETLRGRLSQPFEFPGQLARRLEVVVVARPRHGELMVTANSRGRNGIWQRNGSPLPPDVTNIASEHPVEIWIDATMRPAVPVTVSPIPAFVWKSDPPTHENHQIIKRVTRTALVRIKLARPWFSSGEGERLGIVVWPPDLFSHDADSLARDEVLSSQCAEAVIKRPMDLSNFEDDDLGQGGRFITRWGGDPIRNSAVSDKNWESHEKVRGGTFVPSAAFLDLGKENESGFLAEAIESVQMPLHGSSELTGPEVNFLSVGLVTYEPKFDIESEQWYVDISIEHPIEPEPFLRLGLVRYQSHASAELQLSFPTVQWVQLLPKRAVEVKTRGDKREQVVAIRVEGRIPFSLSLRRSVDGAVAEPRYDDIDSSPLVLARVVREHVRFGSICRRVVVEGSMTMAEHSEMSLRPFIDAWHWEGRIQIDKSLDLLESAKYSVFVDERELRLPATFADEPVSARVAAGRETDRSDLVVSGPRFQARVNILE